MVRRRRGGRVRCGRGSGPSLRPCSTERRIPAQGYVALPGRGLTGDPLAGTVRFGGPDIEEAAMRRGSEPMPAWKIRMGLATAAGLLIALLPSQGAMAAGPAASPGASQGINCAVRSQACPEVWDSESVFGHDVYVGHDEPSLLFYSNKPGSGNNNQ